MRRKASGMKYWSVFAGIVLLIGSFARASHAAETPPEQIEFFEKRVRPVLIAHCVECHGEQKSKGGLNLQSGATALRGGDSGTVIIPGKPAESLLIEAITHAGDIKMPPKSKLPDEQIADLRKWIELGA